ncbi:CHAP domain-containing protein [Planomonospora sp. ID91781]|uniref:CHAP domain-containing protein n=1 Tax=Planomonospora sp. ID91781 TaxID=2738135 RepID=UPI0018C382BF|nr:CHAP domain-containing protein [Planomonospora sp. ID91781]MBG0823319.1 CHAP domain-containing protein [Planomonospora sp. ID91781]
MTFTIRSPRSRVLATAAGLGLVAGVAFTISGTAHAHPSPSDASTSAESLPRVTADDLLKIAEEQIGITENADGGGTKFQDWYVTSQRAKETVERDGGNVNAYANAPWCAMFVSWVGEQAGIRPTVGWDAYTVTWAKWFQDNERWGSKTTPGAVVYFDWKKGDSIYGIDHMALVKKDNGDGTITTIEGNTGNGKVEQRVRPKAEVVGYGYPQYAA